MGEYKFETLQLTEEELPDQGIRSNTIRLSIGTEHIDDIIQDLEDGFAAIKKSEKEATAWIRNS